MTAIGKAVLAAPLPPRKERRSSFRSAWCAGMYPSEVCNGLSLVTERQVAFGARRLSQCPGGTWRLMAARLHTAFTYCQVRAYQKRAGGVLSDHHPVLAPGYAAWSSGSSTVLMVWASTFRAVARKPLHFWSRWVSYQTLYSSSTVTSALPSAMSSTSIASFARAPPGRFRSSAYS